MSARQAILEHLLTTRNAAAERVIDGILADAPPTEQRELADVLLKRNKRAGWVALIRAFNRLDDSVRDQVVASPRDLFGPLAETMQDSDGPARENVIAIVQQCADVKLTFLLAEALIDRRPAVRDLAGRALVESVRTFLAPTPQQRADDPSAVGVEDAVQMDRAVEHGLRQFKTHRQSPALTAALALERRQDGPTWAYFGDTYDELTRAATVILRSPHDPLIARGLLLALGSPLRAAALAGVGAAETPDVVTSLARESYRLVDPVLRISAATIIHVKLFAIAKKHALISPENWRQWLHLLDALGIPGVQKTAVLADMLSIAPPGSGGVAWRIAIAGAAARTATPDAGPVLLRLAEGPDEAVARIAARYLIGRRQAPACPEWRALASTLHTSPHPSVRLIIQQAGKAPLPATRAGGAAPPAPRDTQFDRVWGQYPKLPPAVQHAQTRAAAADPAFSDSLKAKLHAAHVQELAQGLKMLAALPNITPYRGEVIALCGHADARVAAIAVRLAARLNDPRLKDLLELAAHHADERVRANAVESMEDLHIADKSQQVLALLNSRHNRERASAIKAISQFNFATARECLLKMLADPNPVHRISALWVVDRLQLLELVRQVSGMARRDPNARVRKRAATMLDTLTTHLSTGG